MRVFDFLDYKDYMNEKVKGHRLSKGYRAQLAEAAGCKQSFISQVLRTHVQLTPDHAANLSSFWQFSPTEGQYFLNLVLLARAASPRLKQAIKERLKELKAGQEDLSERLQWNNISSEEIQKTYFSSWYWTAIYVMTSIERYSSPQAIAARLNLPLPVVEKTLDALVAWELLKKTKNGWRVTESRIHLPRSSSMNEMNHFNWRQRAMTNIQAQDQQSLHYSLVFALSLEDFERLKEMARQFLESVHTVIGPSPSQELACFTFDLFKV